MRQNAETNKSYGRTTLRDNRAQSVAELCGDNRGRAVNQNLYCEIKKNDKRKLPFGYSELNGKPREQKRRQVVYDRLYNVAYIAGDECETIILFHNAKSLTQTIFFGKSFYRKINSFTNLFDFFRKKRKITEFSLILFEKYPTIIYNNVKDASPWLSRFRAGQA